MPRKTPTDKREVFRYLVKLQDRRSDAVPLMQSYILTASRFRLTVPQVKRIADQGVDELWLETDTELQQLAGGGEVGNG